MDHHGLYEDLFHPATIDWSRTSILDVGSGPLSMFEEFAPAQADITPVDPLGEGYNQLVPVKKFPIQVSMPDRQYGLVACLNCLDHMDAPEQLVEHMAPRLAPGGTAWFYCNIGQPYDPILHPQNFRFWDLIFMIGRHFEIERCGLVREMRLFPYAWWAVCRSRPSEGSSATRQALHLAVCAVTFARFHHLRALVKGAKLIGLRRFLEPELRF